MLLKLEPYDFFQDLNNNDRASKLNAQSFHVLANITPEQGSNPLKTISLI